MQELRRPHVPHKDATMIIPIGVHYHSELQCAIIIKWEYKYFTKQSQSCFVAPKQYIQLSLAIMELLNKRGIQPPPTSFSGEVDTGKGNPIKKLRFNGLS